jgi:capsular polysaccharide biosynthesis protein
VLNEDALLPVLESHGFEIFDPGTLSVVEQAKIFASAEAIISPHSSAMTNLIFCTPGTAVLEIFPADYFDVSFWTAATTSGCRYHAAVGERVGPRPATVIEARRQDLTVPVTTLRNLLDTLFEPGIASAGK